MLSESEMSSLSCAVFKNCLKEPAISIEKAEVQGDRFAYRIRFGDQKIYWIDSEGNLKEGDERDRYGFDQSAKVPEHIRKIVGETVHSWNPGIAKSLRKELNTWKSDLNVSQNKVLAAIENYPNPLGKIRSIQPTSERDSVKKKIAEAAVEASLGSLISAAQLASDEARVLSFHEEWGYQKLNFSLENPFLT
jgi:hypothetical protein